MIPSWAGVPARHRGRDYEHTTGGVRCQCPCGRRSTLARTEEDARRLWMVHIRQVLGRLREGGSREA